MVKPKRTSASASPPKKSKPAKFSFTSQPSGSSALPLSRLAPLFTASATSSTGKARSDDSEMPPPPAPSKFRSKKAEGKLPETQRAEDVGREEKSHSIWAEKYAPTDRASLAIHKRKVENVESWLSDALYGPPQARKYRRLLVLSGPAGAGKTAVLRVLAQQEELDFDIVEWGEDSNVGDWKGVEGNVWRGDSLVQRFSDFVMSACHYKPLSFGPEDETSATSSAKPIPSSPQKKHVILLEDLPNISHLPTRDAFHNALRAAVAVRVGARAGAGDDLAPIVLILSTSTPRADEEDGLAGGSGSTMAGNWATRRDNTTDTRTVLPPDVRASPAYTEISFNPVATTFLKKGIKRVLDGEFPPSTKTSRSRGSSGKNGIRNGAGSQNLHRPSQDAIDLLAAESNGDLRSAINCVQFLACMDLDLEGDGLSDSPNSMAGTKRSANGKPKMDITKGRKGGDTRRRKNLRRVLANMTQRESSLALFHALGKLLYNKRHGDKGDSDTEEAESDQGEDSRRQAAAALLFGHSGSSQNAAHEEWGALPPHLEHLERRKSKVDINAIYTSSPVDPSTLILYLHHNYAPFCVDVEQASKIVEALSYADAKIATRHESWLHNSLIAHLQFQHVTRSALLALPSPAQRRPSSSANRGGGEVFRKPAFFDAQTRSKEMREGFEEVVGWFQRGGRRSRGLTDGLGDPMRGGPLTSEAEPMSSVMGLSLRGDQVVDTLGWIGQLEGAREARGLDRQFPAYFSDLARLKGTQLADSEVLGETELGEGEEENVERQEGKGKAPVPWGAEEEAGEEDAEEGFWTWTDVEDDDD